MHFDSFVRYTSRIPYHMRFERIPFAYYSLSTHLNGIWLATRSGHNHFLLSHLANVVCISSRCLCLYNINNGLPPSGRPIQPTDDLLIGDSAAILNFRNCLMCHPISIYLFRHSVLRHSIQFLLLRKGKFARISNSIGNWQLHNIR